MVDGTKLKGVLETMLIPLMGRALETKKRDGILQDLKSVEIFEGLDYDFEKFSDSHARRSFLRTTIRTAIIDRLLKAFLNDHPEATIVEIGCGLNTRFERLDNGTINWFDLDLPEVYKIWNIFLNETERHKFLPFSAFDEMWMKQVKRDSSKPYFFIAEASVIYFPEKNIRWLFEHLHKNFIGSHYLFDSATPEFLKSLEKSEDALKYCSVSLNWTIENIALLKNWIPEIEILKMIDLETLNHEFTRLYPADFQESTEGYQLNLVRL